MIKSDVMIDLETLGLKPGYVILSIGCAFFNPQGEGHGSTFYRTVDLGDSVSKGFEISKSTVNWWQRQEHSAIQALGVEPQSVEDVFFDFVDWFNGNNGEKVWSQGANMDIPMVEHVLEKLDIRIPWDFWNVRDTRTVYDLFDFDYKSITREGTYHNALQDSIHQVKCVQGAIKKGLSCQTKG